MKRILTGNETFRCPGCGADSFTFAPFCHECGRDFSQEEKLRDLLLATADTRVSPAHATRYSLQWDTLLGLLIVAFVVTLALFTWLHSTNQSNAYHDGLAAIERNEWDAAAARLAEASDHPYARPKLEEVNKKRAERDRLYSTAQLAIEQNQWREARSALLDVQRIEASYKETAQLLATAETYWEQQILAGIVYLVVEASEGVDGTSPGLYLHDAKGEKVKLPGSDAQSVVRAISPDGMALVYDRPSHENSLSDPLAQSDFPDMSQSGRTIVLVRLGQDGSAGILTTIPIPTLHPEGTGVFSQYGLWWHSPRGPSTFDGYDLLHSRPYYLAPSGTVRVNTLGKDGRIVALDPPRSRIVISESIGEARSSRKLSRLYIAGPAGEDPLLLHELAGDVYQASFSRDGQWLLYIAQENGEKITRTVWVLPLLEGSTGRPRKLSSISWSGLEMNVGLTASFLPADGRQHVMVSRTDGKTEQLTIYALELKRGEGGTVWQTATSVGANSYTVSSGLGRTSSLDAGAFSHDGGYVVSTRRQKGEIAALELGDRRDGTIAWTREPLRVFNQQTVRISFTPHDDYLMAVVRNPDGINRGSTEEVYVVPVEDGRLGQPRYAGGAGIPYSRDMPTISLPPDGSVLVYVNAARELKAIFFAEDRAEILVAQHVKAVWSLHTDTDLTWWR